MAYAPSSRPWLGYIFILEDCEECRRPVAVREPHFAVFEEFQGASYLDRYRILLTKLLRERLYDGASLLLTPRKLGRKGHFECPSEELDIRMFANNLLAHAIAYGKSRKRKS